MYAFTWTAHSKWRHFPTNAALITIFRYLEDRNFLVQSSLVNVIVSQTCKILMEFYGTRKIITFLKKTLIPVPIPIYINAVHVYLCIYFQIYFNIFLICA